MYECPGTAITNYCRLGGLKQQKFVLSQLRRPQVWNQNVSKATLPPNGLGKLLFFGSSSFWWPWCPLACSHVNQFPCVFVSSYVSQISLCLSRLRTLSWDSGPTLNSGWSCLMILHLITSAKTLLPIKLTFTVFSSVQSLSRVRLFPTPWIAARQASLSITNSRSSLRLTFTESVMPSNNLILRYPLLLLLSVFPSIRVFSNELVLPIR